MDEEPPQKRFLEDLNTFLEGVDLTPKFIGLLREKHPCNYLLDDILREKNIKDHERDTIIGAHKRQIFSMFTLGRQKCNILADLLEESGQGLKANKLREYNHSEPPWSFSPFNIDFNVIKSTTLRSGYTGYFTMGSKPRGLCVIYLNEPDLINETLRWEKMFKQMDFKVEIYENKKCVQIKHEFKNIANKGINGDAFIMMFIGHGHDEKIRGCTEADEDKMFIYDIVNIFSEENAEKLSKKPKIFVFNCCRAVSQIRKAKLVAEYSYKTNDILLKLDTINPQWMNCNMNTFIFYACAQGKKSWYKKKEGISAFGHAFSLTIAQYAWYKNFTELGKLTNKRLFDEYGKTDRNRRPEMRFNSVSDDLYFNPGLYDKSTQNASTTNTRMTLPCIIKRTTKTRNLNKTQTKKRLAKKAKVSH